MVATYWLAGKVAELGKHVGWVERSDTHQPHSDP
jgi:hypothetical protein